jgi:hypothetical protein
MERRETGGYRTIVNEFARCRKAGPPASGSGGGRWKRFSPPPQGT